MPQIRITKANLQEIQELATYLVEHHKDIINLDAKYKMPKGKDFTPLRKMGIVLGYKGRSVYKPTKDLEISSRSLELLGNRYQELGRKTIENPTAKSNVDKAGALVKKLNGQVIHKGQENAGSTKKHEIILAFENTRWYLYERFVNFIAKKIVRFKPSVIEGQLPVEIETTKERTPSWTGTCTADSSKDFLIILSHIKDEPNSLPTNYLIRINSKSTEIDLCLGHMTFISDRHYNVISKTVVLEKIAGNDDLKPERIMLSELTTDMIKQNVIYKLLHDRKANRLSSPHWQTITSHALLEKWHLENEERKREKRNEHIRGTYHVWYKRDAVRNSPLVKAKLVIDEDVNANLVAKHYHEVDPGKPQLWVGIVTLSPETRAAFIALNGPVRKAASDDTSPIFLILNVPPGGRVFDTLTGVMIGIDDRYEGALGMLIVAVKALDEQDIAKKRLVKLEKFFNAFSPYASIISPQIPVAVFDDLERNMKQKLDSPR